MNRLQKCLEQQAWKFAKTMPQWPHYWALRANWINDHATIEEVYAYWEKHGFTHSFYGLRPKKYIEVGAYRYWFMDSKIENVKILNRDIIEDNPR